MQPPAEPLRVIVADDEPLARRLLVGLLAREPDVTVVAESCNGPETIDAVLEHTPDVLFLDVRMPGADGIEVLETLGPDAVCAVVFVTAFDDYAVSAFEHHALDYVLKPVDDDRFVATLERVRERVRQQNAAVLVEETLASLAQWYRGSDNGPRNNFLSRVVVRSRGKAKVVDVAEVDWIEAADDYLKLHAGADVHLLRGSLGAIEKRLDPAEFARVHRSTIVRLGRVKEMEPYFHGDYSITLADGSRLRLSRTYRASFQAALGQAI